MLWLICSCIPWQTYRHTSGILKHNPLLQASDIWNSMLKNYILVVLYCGVMWAQRGGSCEHSVESWAQCEVMWAQCGGSCEHSVGSCEHSVGDHVSTVCDHVSTVWGSCEHSVGSCDTEQCHPIDDCLWPPSVTWIEATATTFLLQCANVIWSQVY